MEADVLQWPQWEDLPVRRDAERGLFSFLAAAVFLVVAAEQTRQPLGLFSLLVLVFCTVLAIVEANKVTRRVERVLGIEETVPWPL